MLLFFFSGSLLSRSGKVSYSLKVVVTLLAARPQYRKKRVSRSASDLSIGGNHVAGDRLNSAPVEAPAMLVPSLARSRSVREAIQEVKMVQVSI